MSITIFCHFDNRLPQKSCVGISGNSQKGPMKKRLKVPVLNGLPRVKGKVLQNSIAAQGKTRGPAIDFENRMLKNEYEL